MAEVPVDVILPLRHQVFYAKRPIEHASYAGDDHPETHHFAALLTAASGEQEPVGCVSFMPSEYDGDPAWHVRGLAVREDLRRQGIGTALLTWATEDLAARVPQIDRQWCNATSAAMAFYERLGWMAVSEVYLAKGVGTHYRIIR